MPCSRVDDGLPGTGRFAEGAVFLLNGASDDQTTEPARPIPGPARPPAVPPQDGA